VSPATQAYTATIAPEPDEWPDNSRFSFRTRGQSPPRASLVGKAWLLAGSDHGGARAEAMFTLIEPAKLNGR
jgi:hypothetical protein